ncbi:MULTISPECIES: metallophosphoesterase [unclassified Rathayibacter]|uniref:metallophosphoesterase family protein n=1 Tax=unclassified Rathayibacter TaxID=2609250 RepID=UPI000CE7B5C3|nr:MULTISPECIES: metallophosphoesterase [unclassified Rathayibacter]PPG78251.1 hypothetical protein C5C52_13510 [Rathayibacter sp. AY1E5]PPH28444.1 hypothetical protein C5C94_13495 [Rathayibacter sp. AY1C3]PPH62062.1 hypothetical protein C5D25_08475 [Rathayibacter sp. AY1D7]PPI29945.1 hypothetical protein C5D66_10090 [Rathayibacter sp. AY1B4]
MPEARITEQVILQIGDLHYPDFASATTRVDNHDNSVPGALDSSLGLPIPHAIKRAIEFQLSSNPSAILAICGDLTTRGDAQAFRDAARYLATIAQKAKHPQDFEYVHVVPGNHDVAYRGSQPFVSFEDVARFEELATTAEEEGLRNFTVTSRSSSYGSGYGGVDFVSINTCRGAGATREAAAEVSGVSAATESSDSAEILDIPLFHPHEMSVIQDRWGTLDQRLFPVMLGHHGLLPQRIPRLNPYTEMANAGQARYALASLGRTVLYLHGHIHERSTEVIAFPQGSIPTPQGRLVIVSAPELHEGFNKITVKFDPEGYPFGLRIEYFAMARGDQSLSRERTIEIPLGDSMNQSRSQRKILEYLVREGRATGFELLAERDRLSLDVTDNGIETFVEKLCWSGILRKTDLLEVQFNRAGFTL